MRASLLCVLLLALVASAAAVRLDYWATSGTCEGDATRSASAPEDKCVVDEDNSSFYQKIYCTEEGDVKTVNIGTYSDSSCTTAVGDVTNVTSGVCFPFSDSISVKYTCGAAAQAVSALLVVALAFVATRKL